MQTTLRIDDAIYREAKAEAARRGMTLTRFLEDALREKIAGDRDRIVTPELLAEVAERDRQMEALLERTVRFRVGPHPTREEMNAR
jgi:hypothetical protein